MTRERSLEVGCECEFCQADEHPRWEYLFQRVERLERAIRWVLNDAKYKAPEQVDTFMVGRWLAHLNAAVTSVDGEVKP